MQPTIFTTCANILSNPREDMFGPVMSILACDEEKEVVGRANDMAFGFAAALTTGDPAPRIA